MSGTCAFASPGLNHVGECGLRQAAATSSLQAGSAGPRGSRDSSKDSSTETQERYRHHTQPRHQPELHEAGPAGGGDQRWQRAECECSDRRPADEHLHSGTSVTLTGRAQNQHDLQSSIVAVPAIKTGHIMTGYAASFGRMMPGPGNQAAYGPASGGLHLTGPDAKRLVSAVCRM